MDKLQLKTHILLDYRIILLLFEIRNKIAIVFSDSPYLIHIELYNSKTYKLLFIIKEKFSVKNLGVYRFPGQFAAIELKNHDLAFSTNNSDIYIFKILEKSYSLVGRFHQKSIHYKCPKFLNLMDSSLISFTNYFQSYYKKSNDNVFLNLFNHIFHKPQQFIYEINKSYIEMAIEIKPYELVLYIINDNNVDLAVYNLKKQKMVEKLISFNRFDIEYFFLSKYLDKYFIARYNEGGKNDYYNFYFLFFDISKYKIIHKVRFCEEILYSEKYNNILSSFKYNNTLYEWKINNFQIEQIKIHKFKEKFDCPSSCFKTKNGEIIIYGENREIFVYQIVKK